MPVHNELWTRMYLVHKFPKGFRAEAEYQYRWQNTPGAHTVLASYKLAQGTRLWIYKESGQHLTFGLSPFCFFRNYPLISSEADYAKKNSREIRFSGGAEWKQKVSWLEFRLRAVLEDRHFNTDGESRWTNWQRARFRGYAAYRLEGLSASLKPVSVFLADEYFVKGQKLFSESAGFDANRVLGGFSWQINGHLRTDIYYLHILRSGSNGHYLERVLWLNLIVTI